MAIDHGLQGRNNEKSKRKREKRAVKIKQIARGVLTKKKEVFFDEASRVDYLVGFRQRKQERRKYGLAMQILKNKKSSKEKSKERKLALSATLISNTAENSEENGNQSDAESENEGEETELNSEGTLFNDDATTEMFGAPVQVQIDDSIGQQLDDLKNPDLVSFENRKPMQMTRKDVYDMQLKKAMKIVKKTMNQKKPSKKKNDKNSKENAGGGKDKKKTKKRR